MSVQDAVTVDAGALLPGDVFRYAGTCVTVLREQEPWRDLFGREMFRYWCQRLDTGAEGWMPFGPGGTVEVP